MDSGESADSPASEEGKPVGGQDEDPRKGDLDNAGPRGRNEVVGKAEEREGAVVENHGAGEVVGGGADAVQGDREVKEAEGRADVVDREVEEVGERTDAAVD